MAQARSDQQWNHTAAILAMIVNANRDPKKTKAAKPMDFHPSLARAETDLEVGIEALKAFVPKKGKP